MSLFNSSRTLITSLVVATSLVIWLVWQQLDARVVNQVSNMRLYLVTALTATAIMVGLFLIAKRRARRGYLYPHMFRQVRYNGMRMTRFWADLLKRSQSESAWSVAGQTYPRIRHGEEDKGTARLGPCVDCGAAVGQYHALACEAEPSPRCLAQRFCCDCECDRSYEFDLDRLVI
ncbi:hypothetical protein F6455_16555 [Proteobacteria bacterium 005FR1]|nr:hypothetical protein [Proteobacteria bacterium 005FR1]